MAEVKREEVELTEIQLAVYEALDKTRAEADMNRRIWQGVADRIQAAIEIHLNQWGVESGGPDGEILFSKKLCKLLIPVPRKPAEAVAEKV